MIFLDRSRRGEDPHLEWKIVLFWVGAVLALAGMAMDRPVLVTVAIVVLVVGFLLRFPPFFSSDSPPSSEEKGEEEDTEETPPGPPGEGKQGPG